MTAARYIDSRRQALLSRLRRLVAFRTVNPPGDHYDEITRWLTDELSSMGLSARRYTMSRSLMSKVLPREQQAYPRFNVLAKLAVPGARKTIHFNAHYDVVPVSGEWRHGDAFSGAVKGGWIHGRGTADMKGSIASLLTALESLQKTRTTPKVNIEVSFTADEETDSELGSSWLVRNAPIRPDYAVVMEGGEGNAVCCGHNGTLWLEVIVHGRAAHGSRPDEGVNALEKMSGLVLALEQYKKRLSDTSWETPQGTTMHPTINVGGVFDCGEGAKINTVPARAAFTIDRRVLPIENHDTAEKELRAFLTTAAREIAGCTIEVRKISENFACFSQPEDPFFTAMAGCVSRVRREPTVFSVSTGFNDMHFFSHALRIPTLGYGPGGERIHAVNERAQVKELVAAAKIYVELLTRFDGNSG